MHKQRMRKIKLQEGALHRQFGIPEDEEIPTAQLEDLKKSKNPSTKKRAVFALNARNWQRPARKRKTRPRVKASGPRQEAIREGKVSSRGRQLPRGRGHRRMSKTEQSVWNSLKR